MENNITPQQALQNLYQASTLARLTAEEHRVLTESAKILDEIINPKKFPTTK
jgi:hypothetical protein